jgi:hypothetical protein
VASKSIPATMTGFSVYVPAIIVTVSPAEAEAIADAIVV